MTYDNPRYVNPEPTDSTVNSDPSLAELNATIAQYPDPDDKLTIALGNFNRVRAERDEYQRLWHRDAALLRELREQVAPTDSGEAS